MPSFRDSCGAFLLLIVDVAKYYVLFLQEIVVLVCIQTRHHFVVLAFSTPANC